MNQSGRHPLPLWQVPAAGDWIGGVYEVVGEIGSGAMGVVLLAVDQQLGRRVAIKFIHPWLCTSDFREHFLREARAMAELSHPNLLSIHAFDFRDLLDFKLRMEFPGADVECVSDGQAALDALERNPPSVVILDLMMPVLDGAALTVQLRSRSEYARVPILVLTASGGPNEWQFLSSIGADRFLVKPVDLDDVVTLVRRTIRESAQSDDFVGACWPRA